MTITDKAYISGLETGFMAHGLSKQASQDAIITIASLSKKASPFNFSDSQSGGGFSLSSLLIPLLAAAGTGYVTYNAAATGSKNKSAFQNIKNYIGGNLEKVLRPKKSPALFGFTQLSDH